MVYQQQTARKHCSQDGSIRDYQFRRRTMSDSWYHLELGDDDNVYFDDGRIDGIAPRHFLFSFGKYAGRTLAEVNDVWYLNFLMKMAVEKKDWWLQKCVTMRAKEL